MEEVAESVMKISESNFPILICHFVKPRKQILKQVRLINDVRYFYVMRDRFSTRSPHFLSLVSAAKENMKPNFIHLTMSFFFSMVVVQYILHGCASKFTDLGLIKTPTKLR